MASNGVALILKRSYLDAANRLDDGRFRAFINALALFAYEETEPDGLTGSELVAFEMARDEILASRRRFLETRNDNRRYR